MALIKYFLLNKLKTGHCGLRPTTNIFFAALRTGKKNPAIEGGIAQIYEFKNYFSEP